MIRRKMIPNFFKKELTIQFGEKTAQEILNKYNDKTSS